MKFSGIPMFPHASYSVTISWRYLEAFLVSAIGEDGLDINPDFQRGHVWTQSQQTAYVEYVLRGGRSGKDIWCNCPNWSSASGNGPYVLVDGLQRLTAVRTFLRDGLPVFGHTLSEYSDRPDRIHCAFQWHVTELNTRAEVLNFYLDFNAGGTPHAAEEIARVRRMLEAETKGTP